MGLACHSEIVRDNYFARKNYFPDPPKRLPDFTAYDPDLPGVGQYPDGCGGERTIYLNRIHLEEDAGKSLHDIDAENTGVDFSRAGTALIEMW